MTANYYEHDDDKQRTDSRVTHIYSFSKEELGSIIQQLIECLVGKSGRTCSFLAEDDTTGRMHYVTMYQMPPHGQKDRDEHLHALRSERDKFLDTRLGVPFGKEPGFLDNEPGLLAELTHEVEEPPKRKESWIDEDGTLPWYSSDGKHHWSDKDGGSWEEGGGPGPSYTDEFGNS